MLIIIFQRLWATHPRNTNPLNENPCLLTNGKPSHLHECAVRMSVALMNSGVNLNHVITKNGLPAVKCDYNRLAEHKYHYIRAEQLAEWLSRSEVLGKPTFTIPKQRHPITSVSQFKQTAREIIAGKNRIVFFKDFYGAGNQGEHIDVWKSNKTSPCPYEDTITYFENAEVWFWELN